MSPCEKDRCDCRKELEDIKKALNVICCELGRIAEELRKNKDRDWC